MAEVGDDTGAQDLMGLAPLLRAWRSEAGFKRGLGRALTQVEVAARADVSERWYRKLESGAPVGPEPTRLASVAAALGLDQSQTATLFLYRSGQLPVMARGADEDPTIRTLEVLLDRLMPTPAWISDNAWNIITCNKAAAEWLPFLTRPGANIIRWFLLDEEARQQTANWESHAIGFLGLVRYAYAQHRDDERIGSLLNEILQDKQCAALWRDSTTVTASRNGAIMRLLLPIHHFEPVDVLAHFLHPANKPTCRIAVLTRIAEGAGGDSATVAVAAGGYSSVEEMNRAETGLRALPGLSLAAGEGNSLYLRPDGMVVWATEGGRERWSVSVLSPYATLVRLPEAAAHPAAGADYGLVVRASLPRDPDAALVALESLRHNLAHRMARLADVEGKLMKEPPG